MQECDPGTSVLTVIVSWFLLRIPDLLCTLLFLLALSRSLLF